MDIKRCTIDSQDILRHENARAFFVCLLSFVLSLLILGAALFGVYSLYTVSGLDKEKYSVPVLSLLYALFSSEVTVSLFALSAVSYNRKIWFYRNASEKAPVSYLFAGEKFSVRLKVFYFFFFKKLMTALCLVAAEIPFLLCSLVFLPRALRKRIIQNRICGSSRPLLCAVFARTVLRRGSFENILAVRKGILQKQKMLRSACRKQKQKPDRGKPVQACKL